MQRQNRVRASTFLAARASERVVVIAKTALEVARDEATYAGVFEANHRALLRLAYLLCGDIERAEDVVAEAFASVYPKWRRGGVQDVGAYLRRATVNGVRGGMRRRAVVVRELVGQRGDVGVDPIENLAAARDVLRRALVQLPLGQRAAIALRYLEDRSEAESAAILGVSVGTVKAQVSRGLRRLRALIGEETL